MNKLKSKGKNVIIKYTKKYTKKASKTSNF